MKGPEHIRKTRLVLRKPTAADAEAIYTRYSSDTEVTKYVGWPRHQCIEQTKAFLTFSEAVWSRWPAGPYLIECRGDRKLLGGTGLTFETPTVVATGYVLARDSWGYGYATEALAAVVAVARELGVRRLYALCHPNHKASIRVLEKCGFVLEDLLAGFADFPNLGSGQHEDCLRYVQGAGCRSERITNSRTKHTKPIGNLNPFAVSTMKGANPPSAWDQLKDH